MKLRDSQTLLSLYYEPNAVEVVGRHSGTDCLVDRLSPAANRP